jgi:hypothetical protein
MAANCLVYQRQLPKRGIKRRAEYQSHTREGSGDLSRLCMIPISHVGTVTGSSRVLRTWTRAAIHLGALTPMTPPPSPLEITSVYPSPQMRMVASSNAKG